MKRNSVILPAALTFVLLAGARWRVEGVGVAGESEAHAAAEVRRLRAHFDSVDVELRARDVSRLTPAQRARRTTLTSWLREYRDAGVFPVNDRFPQRTIPFFRDSRGTLCAMAWLIARSERRDMVDRIAGSRNNAFIRELADDRELIAWLDSAGLDVSEAARIQPAYGGIGSGADNVSANYALATIALGGGSLAATAVNVMSPSKTSGVIGLILGTAAIVNGVNRLDCCEGSGTRKIAVASLATGTGSLASGLYALLARRTKHHEARATSSAREFFATAVAAPTISLASDSMRVGVGLTARF